jgi:carbamate kinase
VCGADSQGAIGYEFQQALQNELFRRGIQKNVCTVITQTLVDADDPAFTNPTKPIGSFMDEAEARRRKDEMGWSVVEDAGRGWRRVVASPQPKEIVELDSVRTLIEAGVTVITVGGGGIPVIDAGNGEYRGIAAVIDKDFASSLLAQEINADLFLIATAVEKVAINFGKPDQKWLDRITLAEARQYLAEGIHFAKGSMAPKMQAVIWYLEAGGKPSTPNTQRTGTGERGQASGGRQAIITNPENIGRALKGETGTWIIP